MPAPSSISIQTQDFDLGAEVAALRAGDGGVGAVVSFVGTVRGSGGGRDGGADGAGDGSATASKLFPDGSALEPEPSERVGAMALATCERVGAMALEPPERVGAMELEPSERVSAMELEHYPGMTERAIQAMLDAAHQRFDIRAARVVHRVGLLPAGAQIVLVAVASAHRGQAFQACEFLIDYLKTQAPFWKKETTPDGARWVDARVDDDAALARWGVANRGGGGGVDRESEGEGAQ